MGTLHLSRGLTAEVDDELLEDLRRVKWRVVVRPHTSYAQSHELGLLHRHIMGNPEDLDVDHKNGNGLDCRRQNLRIASQQQNSWNQGLRRNNKSGVKGVSWDRSCSRWVAMVRFGGRKVNLGRFVSIPEAAEACAAFRARHHGEFANNGEW